MLCSIVSSGCSKRLLTVWARMETRKSVEKREYSARLPLFTYMNGPLICLLRRPQPSRLMSCLHKNKRYKLCWLRNVGGRAFEAASLFLGLLGSGGLTIFGHSSGAQIDGTSRSEWTSARRKRSRLVHGRITPSRRTEPFCLTAQRCAMDASKPLHNACHRNLGLL